MTLLYKDSRISVFEISSQGRPLTSFATRRRLAGCLECRVRWTARRCCSARMACWNDSSRCPSVTGASGRSLRIGRHALSQVGPSMTTLGSSAQSRDCFRCLRLVALGGKECESVHLALNNMKLRSHSKREAAHWHFEQLLARRATAVE